MYNQFRLLGQVNPDNYANGLRILHFILELFENLKS